MRYRVNFKETAKNVQADVTVEGHSENKEEMDEVFARAQTLYDQAQTYARLRTIEKMR